MLRKEIMKVGIIGVDLLKYVQYNKYGNSDVSEEPLKTFLAHFL